MHPRIPESFFEVLNLQACYGTNLKSKRLRCVGLTPYDREFSLQQLHVECSQLKSYLFRDPFSAAAPIVWTEGDDLFLKTSFFQHAISLFAYCKILSFSKGRKVLEIRTKKWWRWKSPIRIPFSEIDYLDLTYPDALHEAGGDGICNLFIVTKNPSKRVDLFRFSSDASTGPSYRKMAEGCADLIATRTGIRFALYTTYDTPLGALHKTCDIPLPDFNDKYVCKACGHRLHPESGFVLCPYCGGKEFRME